MKENNKRSELDSIKLTYNEKSMRISAELTTDVDGVKLRSKTINDAGVIKSLIESFSKQNKMSVSELIDNGLIIVDDKLLDRGVIILDSDKEYKKYIFDRNIGSFVSTKLSRMEQKDLGIRDDFGKLEEPTVVVTEEKKEPVKDDKPEKVIIKEEVISPKEVVTSEKVKEEVAEPVVVESADGAMDVTESSPTVVVTEEKTTGVRNLKVTKVAFGILAAGAIILAGSLLTKKNNDDAIIDKGNTNPTPEPVIATETLSIYPVETPSGDYYQDSNDVQFVTQRINDMCISYQACNFYDLVIDREQLSLKVINDARNAAITNRESKHAVMDEYVKYIFEGGILFKDDIIEGYDYLTPLSKYAVLVSGQTLLQVCDNYSFVVNGHYYDFGILTEGFNERINEVYQEMLTKGRTI